MMIRLLFILSTILAQTLSTTAHATVVHESLSVKAKNGDGIISLLRRYKLHIDNANTKSFYTLNDLNSKSQLISGASYKIPVRIFEYDNKSIRSTIGDDNWDKAVRIKTYNEWLLDHGLRSTHYTDSKLLWVPYHELTQPKETESKTQEVATTSSKESSRYDLFGTKHAQLNKVDNLLAGRVYYLISGHGGIDPGAVCDDCSKELCEDEYAYDVTLRLAKNLMEHGAAVEIIIQDKQDGIRDDKYLSCDHDERLANNEKLVGSQIKRLNQRAHYVNNLYRKYQNKGVKEQLMISIHVDSRSKSSRQDVFFNYYPSSKSSKALAADIMTTFEEKYALHQKGRNYKGYINARNLHVLRVTQPKAVLIELANIKNPFDHKRILLHDNRQALANWIFEGITKRVIKKSNKMIASS